MSDIYTPLALPLCLAAALLVVGGLWLVLRESDALALDVIAADIVLENALHQQLRRVVDARVVLGRGLEPAHKAVVLAELVHLFSDLRELVLGEVDFVGQQHDGNGLVALGQLHLAVNVVLPLLYCFKCGQAVEWRAVSIALYRHRYY